MTKRIADMTPEQRERARATQRKWFKEVYSVAALKKRAQKDPKAAELLAHRREYERKKYADPMKRKRMLEAVRRYKARNKDRIRAESRRYRQKNRARYNESHKQWYARRIAPLKAAKRNPVVKLFRNWTPNLEAA